MASSEFAVSELLNALRTGQAMDLIRESVRMVLQELIEAEATDVEPRRRIDQALYAVVMEAYVAGVSTRSVDDLVTALGIDSGISRSEVSRICAGLDEVVTAFAYPPAGPHRVPVRLPRGDLPARAQRHLPGRLHGRRGRHRHHRRRRRPGSVGPGRGQQRGRSVLARLPVRFETTPTHRCGWSSPTSTPASLPRSNAPFRHRPPTLPSPLKP
jgi:hypothetical protein